MEVASGAAESRRWASIRSRSADAGEPDIPGIVPDIPGIVPDSRAYRAAEHISEHISGQPDSRAAGHTGHIGHRLSRNSRHFFTHRAYLFFVDALMYLFR